MDLSSCAQFCTPDIINEWIASQKLETNCLAGSGAGAENSDDRTWGDRDTANRAGVGNIR